MDRFSGDISMFGKFGGVVIVILSAAIIAGLVLRPSPDELPAAMSLGVTPATTAPASQLEPVTPVVETVSTETPAETPTDSTIDDAAAVVQEVTDSAQETTEAETAAEATPTEAVAEPEASTEAESDTPASEDKPAQ